MYDYIVLDRSLAPNYNHLTYFWLQERLNLPSSPYSTTIAIGSVFGGQPVGLVLADYLQDRHTANILSLFVDKKHRQQGIGTALLIQIEKILTEYGCQQTELLYSFNLMTPVVERMLKQQNWTTGADYSLQCLTNRESILRVPFLNRYTLPAKYTIFPWSQLTDKERTKIQQRANGLDYPDELYPFREERNLSSASVGLRYQNEVIGWNIVTQLIPSFVSFKSLFVKEKFRSTGLGIHLLTASINRQALDEKVTDAMFIALLENTQMVRFVHRHLAPYLTSVINYWKASKSIKMPASSYGEPSLNLPLAISD
jgi:GNAT superfamily N-acetyltransferase